MRIGQGAHTYPSLMYWRKLRGTFSVPHDASPDDREAYALATRAETMTEQVVLCATFLCGCDCN